MKKITEPFGPFSCACISKMIKQDNNVVSSFQENADMKKTWNEVHLPAILGESRYSIQYKTNCEKIDTEKRANCHELALDQGSLTQIYRGGGQHSKEKLLWATIYMKSPKIWSKSLLVLRCLRAAQMHLTGHTRPASRVFETPARDGIKVQPIK
jgi:hypothetical protein